MPHVARDKIAIALVCLGFGAFGAGGTLALNQLSKASDEAVTTSTLEESCERFGNPLREGLREFFEQELERAEHPDPKVLEQFGLTTEEAKELSAKRIAELKFNINVRFKEVPCDTIYKESE